MVITISPAKSLNYKDAPAPNDYTLPYFINESDYLVKKLKKKSVGQLQKLMGISSALAELNHERYQQWEQPLTPPMAKKAIDVFSGDVYTGLDIKTADPEARRFLDSRLLILSGLYGALKTTDIILPYRLEMGASFKVTPTKTNLYAFWGHRITDFINDQLKASETKTLLNLASKEYFKSIKTKDIKGKIITPEFKDQKNGTYKIISFFAKKARGMMVRFIADHQLTNPQDIKAFDRDGYYFNQHLSNETKWVFTRDQSF